MLGSGLALWYLLLAMDPKRLMIVDGFSLLYRAFYGTRFLSTSDGRPTNAIFGFVQMLFALIEQQKPIAILVALDTPAKTFRHAEFPEYKGTRREMPLEMQVQIPLAFELIDALGIPKLQVTGFEADDIVGTVSKKAEQNGYHTTIVTGDLDTLQLVDSAVTVATPKGGVTEPFLYNPEEVFARYGFPPEFVPDYKALVGDTSDNIPGVPGIGDKSATYLIQKFGRVEQMIERMDEIEEKFRKKLIGQEARMRQSKWLATIDCNVPLEFSYDAFETTPEQLEKARAMFELLELRAPLKRLQTVLGPYVQGFVADSAPVEVVSERVPARAVPSAKSFEAAEKWLDGRQFAIFLPGSIQQSMFEDEGSAQAYLAVGSEVMACSSEIALKVFESDPSKAIAHDSKPLFAKTKTTATGPAFDSMLAGFVLQSGRGGYAFRDLAQGYLDSAPPETPEECAVTLYQLRDVLRARIDKEGQTRVLDEIELPLVPLLAEMERYGIKVSSGFLLDFSKSLQVTIDQKAKLIFEMAGQEFLIASPKQLGEVLFEKLAIPGSKKTKTGYATGAEVLQVLAPQYPICGEVLSWRELTKLKSTYADSLPKLVAGDGRIHTTYNQVGAATGRLSSNDPNLQNIPIRTELGRQIRKAFVAEEGFRLGSFDYSQIELRILAHYCGDDALVAAFQKHEDVHTATASLMFGVEPAQVDRTQRGRAKTLNYAVAYGVTDFGLANQMHGEMSQAEAKQLIEQYFARFPKIKAFTDSTIEEARSKGFTTTLMGRRRYFPDIHAANRTERMYAERQAINAPLQGTAADMMKLAMLAARQALGDETTRMLLSVHDEIVFEMASGSDGLVEPIRKAMEGALPLQVPVEVDAKAGPNWDEMTPIPRPD